jgi:hypothetical protein
MLHAQRLARAAAASHGVRPTTALAGGQQHQRPRPRGTQPQQPPPPALPHQAPPQQHHARRPQQQRSRLVAAAAAAASPDSPGSGGSSFAGAAKELQQAAALDELIDMLLAAASQQELSRVVAENIFSFDAKFWMRVATRNDSLADAEQKERLRSVADAVMLLVDAMVKQTEQQLNDSASILQAILRAAADANGEWYLPLEPDQVWRRALRCAALRFVALCFAALRCVVSLCVVLCCVALCPRALRCVVLCVGAAWVVCVA